MEFAFQSALNSKSNSYSQGVFVWRGHFFATRQVFGVRLRRYPIIFCVHDKVYQIYNIVLSNYYVIKSYFVVRTLRCGTSLYFPGSFNSLKPLYLKILILLCSLLRCFFFSSGPPTIASSA